MKQCKYCKATGEDSIIERHENFCQYLHPAPLGKAELEAQNPEQIAAEAIEELKKELAPVEEAPEEIFLCSKCGKACKTAAGLATHEKSCKGV